MNRLARCRLVVSALASIASGVFHSGWMFAGEAGRPPERFDARKSETDRAKKDTDQRDERAWGKESARPKDITNEKKPEFHDLDSLSRLSKTEPQNEQTKTLKQNTTDDLAKLSEKLDIRKAGDDKTNSSERLKDMNKIGSDKMANDVAKKLGYKDAHDLKGDFGVERGVDMYLSRDKKVYVGDKNGIGEPRYVGNLGGENE